MFTQYTVKFFTKAGEPYDLAQFFVNLDCESLLDRLEEVLYIAQGLSPVHRDWKRDLCTNGRCLFTYHSAEHCLVSYDWDQGCLITVQDI